MLRPNWSRTVDPDELASRPPAAEDLGCCSSEPPGPGEELDDGLADLLQLGTELLQHLGGDTLALANEAEEDVLGPDVVVAELERLTQTRARGPSWHGE